MIFVLKLYKIGANEVHKGQTPGKGSHGQNILQKSSKQKEIHVKTYCKVASTSASFLEPHLGIYRLGENWTFLWKS